MSSFTEDTLAGYQQAARSTAIYPGQDSNAGLLYAVLGLSGEAGECANTLKKALRDGPSAENTSKLYAELGDVLWYVAAVASELGVSLADVAEANLDKLRSRFDAGTLRGSGDDR